MNLYQGKEPKNSSHFTMAVSLLLLALLLTTCSFDYGDTGDSEKGRPDIVMENIEYVRVRRGDPQVRFTAEYAERWEELQTMEIRNFAFEQFEDRGETVNAEGRAGTAVVQLESGDVAFSDGVTINIETEDIIIKTAELDWIDDEKLLFGSENAEVEIERSDGTSFTGVGFSADARNRTWAFSGEVRGIYVEEDDEEESGDEAAEESDDADEGVDDEERAGMEPRQPLPGRRISN